MIAACGADAVYWNRLYEPALLARDRAIKQQLRARGIAAHSSNAALLIEPWQLATGEGKPYRVFTPFWRSALTRLDAVECAATPQRIVPPQVPGSLPLAALDLPPRARWDHGLAAHWQPGQQGAAALLQQFIVQSLPGYKAQRDYPALTGTSRLSPHLHFGEIGPRQILAALDEHVGNYRACCAGSTIEPYVRELGWREFSHHLLYHFPHTSTRNLNAQFDAFPWADAGAHAEAL